LAKPAATGRSMRRSSRRRTRATPTWSCNWTQSPAGRCARTGKRPEEAANMKIDGVPWRTIWREPDSRTVGVIDQTKLPHRFETLVLATEADAAQAIRAMIVRGAPLIGATAAYGLAM